MIFRASMDYLRSNLAQRGGWRNGQAEGAQKQGEDTMKKISPVVHFEMPYDDHERVAKFYTESFGWHMQKLGEEMGDYVLATTTETDENNMVKTPGTINGGFFPKRPDSPSQYPSVVIAVDNIKEAIQSVTDAGGKVLGEVMEIPGVGHYAPFIDTEGNLVGMLQPVTM
jgi:uncharacterized protein